MSEINKDLMEVETTSSNTGYPSNIIKATIGFKTFEEAQAFAEKHDGWSCYLEQEAGWNVWYRRGPANAAMEISETDYGDLTTIVRKGYYSSEEECVEDVFAPWVEGANVKTITERAANIKEIWDAYSKLEDGQAVILYDGWFEEVISLQTTYWSNDNKFTTIGVVHENY